MIDSLAEHAGASRRIETVPMAHAVTRREQIERLFREHNDSLVRFVLAQLHDLQEAREVAQEAYVRVLARDGTETVSYLRMLLFRTAGNIAIDRLRRRSCGRSKANAFEIFEGERCDPSLERSCGAAQELELIQKAIDELPPLCREVLILVRFEGLSVRDAAQRLGLNSRTVFRYVARAIEHCHSALEKDQAAKERLSGTRRSIEGRGI